MSGEKNAVQHAALQWDEQGQPSSSLFDDVYFSRSDGLEETRHVFLQHNQLAERWRQLGSTDHFVIGETGFGSGLNFLAAWDLWLTIAPPGAQLHFVSVEKFPLCKTDLARVLSLWPCLSFLSNQLIEAYPCIVGNGFHRLSFMNGRIKLTIIINDAAAGLRKLLATPDPIYSDYSAKVDAWFLDGFAPAKNPQMWSEDLFSCIHLLSRQGTTAATFSAAAIVKKGLKFAGFSIQKVPGFGRKREMLKAVMRTDSHHHFFPQPAYRSVSPFPSSWTLNNKALHVAATDASRDNNKVKRALIIGAGLAGCTSARALAERGWQVTVIERSDKVAAGASGNPQGVLYAKLSHKEENQAEFNLASLQFAQAFYGSYWQKVGEKTGVLQLAYSEPERLLQSQLRQKFSGADGLVQFVSAERAGDIAGMAVEYDALFFPEAGWINPAKLCEHLLDHPKICVVTETDVKQIHRDDSHWCVNNDMSLMAEVLVIANAQDAASFEQTRRLPIKAIRGQISYLPMGEASRSLKTVVCADGYVAPAQGVIHCTGATFTLRDGSTDLRAEDHALNIKNACDALPQLSNDWQSINPQSLEGRVAFRCALPDYLPAVGPVANETAMVECFAPLRKNARAAIHSTGQYLPGLYVNIGHGSRGLAYTPLCAEILAAHINNEPQPAAIELVNALNPARFVIRELIKNKR